jgi:hypothetical protein
MPYRNRSEPYLVVTLTPASLERLKSRGALSDRHHGPLSYTRQLTRSLELHEAVLVRSDPRDTRELPEEQYDLILSLLSEPEKLEVFHIQKLGDYLRELPAFAGLARRLGVDPDEFAKWINSFSFAEKLQLLDSAKVRNAGGAKRPRTDGG